MKSFWTNNPSDAVSHANVISDCSDELHSLEYQKKNQNLFIHCIPHILFCVFKTVNWMLPNWMTPWFWVVRQMIKCCVSNLPTVFYFQKKCSFNLVYLELFLFWSIFNPINFVKFFGKKFSVIQNQIAQLFPLSFCLEIDLKIAIILSH